MQTNSLAWARGLPAAQQWRGWKEDMQDRGALGRPCVRGAGAWGGGLRRTELLAPCRQVLCVVVLYSLSVLIIVLFIALISLTKCLFLVTMTSHEALAPGNLSQSFLLSTTELETLRLLRCLHTHTAEPDQGSGSARPRQDGVAVLSRGLRR